jgi:glucosylceramidase
MGASDYAVDRYTEDETAGDTAMLHFSIDRDMQRLIPFVKAALAIRPDIRFWASPWTPPTWMKNGMKAGSQPSPFDGGSMVDNQANLNAYTQYFIKFIQAYQQQGITLEFVPVDGRPLREVLRRLPGQGPRRRQPGHEADAGDDVERRRRPRHREERAR